MIKTNVRPYIFMSKYALQHFIEHAGEHNHRNALIYVSGTAAFADMPYMATYIGTKKHSYALSSLLRQYVQKSETLADLVTI